MCGGQTYKSWSATQKSIALSSGEAELIAVVKMSCEIIGVMQMMREWGLETHGRVWVDSSAALGIVKRRGNGKMRHVRVGQLWVQQAQEEGELAYEKILGTANPSDLQTKYLAGTEIARHMRTINQHYEDGKSSKGLEIV